MNDLISRSHIMDHIEEERREWGKDYDVEQVLGDIEDFPAVDAVPIRRGHWIFGESKGPAWMKCSLCLVSQTATGVFTFCPNCGAFMIGAGPDKR